MKLIEELLQVLESSVQDAVRKGAKDKDLKFEKTDKSHCVCSIAFSEKHNAWIGFSHRAMAIFTIGDMLFDADFRGDFSEEEIGKMPFKQRGEIKIKKLEQAKQAASNFAEYVS